MDNQARLDEVRRRKALGAFFKNYRQRTKPLDGEHEFRRRRRLPGMTRAEVAAQLYITPEYYEDFEQGRVAIARTLLIKLMDLFDLNDHERRYAMKLATGLTLAPSPSPEEQVPEAQQMVLDNFHPHPAYLIGRRTDILAWNTAACAVFGDFAQYSAEERNIALQLFVHPWTRTFIEDWEIHARRLVRQMRADYVQYWNDLQFDALVEHLLAESLEFAIWWNEHDVGTQAEINKIFNHPGVGYLAFKQMAYDAIDAPGIRVVLYVPLDRETQTKMRELVLQTAR